MKLGASLTALFSGAARKADTRSRVADRIARGSVPGRELDPLLIWSAIGLLLLGLVMVYSASIAIAEGSRFTGYQPYYFVTRHALFLTIGIGCGLLAFKLPMAHWQQMAPWLFVGGVVLLVAQHVAESLRDSIGVSERRPHVDESLRDSVPVSERPGYVS